MANSPHQNLCAKAMVIDFLFFAGKLLRFTNLQIISAAKQQISHGMVKLFSFSDLSDEPNLALIIGGTAGGVLVGVIIGTVCLVCLW